VSSSSRFQTTTLEANLCTSRWPPNFRILG
jgi:hypothetical protein